MKYLKYIILAAFLLLPFQASASYVVSQGGTATSTFTQGIVTTPGGTAFLRSFVCGSPSLLLRSSSTAAVGFDCVATSTLGFPTVSFPISVSNGGTGTSTAPTLGQILLGNAGGGYSLAATSSLGIPTSQWNSGASNSISYVLGDVISGTTTPASLAFDAAAATSTAATLSGTAYYNSDGSVNGTGTHFMTQLHVGDVLDNSYSAGTGDLVTAVDSDTLAYVMKNTFYNFYGTQTTGLLDYSRIAGFTSLNGYSAGITGSKALYNSGPGVGAVLNGATTFIANTEGTNGAAGGIEFDDVAADGRMYMHHSHSQPGQGGGYLQFSGGNQLIVASGLSINSSTFAAPLYLGAQSFSGNVNSIYVDKAGDGAGKTMYLTTMSYASADGSSPLLQVSGNGISLGTRPAFWDNYYYSTSTLVMKPSGEWSIDSATASTSPFSVYGFASQQAPLTTWLNSSSSTLAVMSASGFLGLGTSTPPVSLTVASSTGSVTLSADASTGKVNVSNLPRGTTGFPPSGLVTGDLWWDTTTNLINIKP